MTQAGCDPCQRSRNKINAQECQRSKRLLVFYSYLLFFPSLYDGPLRFLTPGTELTSPLNSLSENTFLHFPGKKKT